MQVGDILVSFNGKEVKDIKDFTKYLMEINPGDTVEIIYLHNGNKITKQVKLNAK
jgi:S1-C subfamily serine protease